LRRRLFKRTTIVRLPDRLRSSYRSNPNSCAAATIATAALWGGEVAAMVSVEDGEDVVAVPFEPERRSVEDRVARWAVERARVGLVAIAWPPVARDPYRPGALPLLASALA
jgi:hypothetical protein